MRRNEKPTYHYFQLRLRFIGFLAFIVFIASCSNTKHLSPSEFLYSGADIQLKTDGVVPQKKKLISTLNDAIYPEPNRKFLGLVRLRLWFYYLAGQTKKNKGFKHWLKYKLGEPPVLLEYVNQENVSHLISSNAFNRGHFKTVVSQETEIKKKRTRSILMTRIK